MTVSEFQVRGVDDARLAIHATGSLPAWLWATDGTRILWANPVGASLFDARHATALAARIFGPADPHRRQIAQLAGRLRVDGGVRLERLRGFGATFGRLATCACSKLAFADGTTALLIVAVEPLGRAMPLVERLQRLVEGVEVPVAAFGRDGLFVGASDAARALLGFRNLSEAGLDAARDGALRQGRVETPIGVGHVVLQRVGSGADVALVALLAPGTVLRAAEPDREPGHAPVAIPDQPEQDTESAASATIETSTPEAIVSSHTDQTSVPDHAAAMHAFDAVDETGALLVEPLPDSPAPSTDAAAPPSDPVLPIDFVDHLAQDADNADAVGDVADTIASHPAADHQSEPPPEKDASEPVASHDDLAPDLTGEAPAEFALADEVVAPPVAEPSTEAKEPQASVPVAAATPRADLPLRRNPLRFVWHMQRDGRLELRSDDLLHLVGPHTAAILSQRWDDITATLPIDPDGRVAAAVATRATWSGIALDLPVDPPGQPLPVELTGLPAFDATGAFDGYRGFGVCRDLDALSRLDAIRRNDGGDDPTPGASPHPPPAHPSPPDHDAPRDPAAEAADTNSAAPVDASASSSSAPSEPAASAPASSESEQSVDIPLNVVPLRPHDPKSPALTPVENNAFNELARQLSARLENDHLLATDAPAIADAVDAPVETEAAVAPPDWLGAPATPAAGTTSRDRVLMDLLPVGILIYRLDRLLYANPAFLARVRCRSLQELEEAGGLDSLYIEPDVSSASSTSDTGTPVTIAASLATAGEAASAPTAARLYAITWDGEAALALIGAPAATPAAAPAPSSAAPAHAAPPVAASTPGHPDAEELGAILDTAAEGIVMFDGSGRIHACNRSAEALFGYDGAQLTQRPLSDLFAPESRDAVAAYLARIKSASASGLHDHGRQVLGSVRSGGLMPLALTMGRTRDGGPNFFAVFRDLTQLKKSEAELAAARRQTERAANAKAEVLSRISHEVRTPLNAIIGFADVMIEERFGPLGNERYVEYMKDVRASGERVVAIIDDLSNLARIETGNIDLAFASQDLNMLVEQCVGALQPQANRERIIIRSSMAHELPPVVADARALRQIMLNLIGNSIHLARAGGQVIVSTALSDLGEVVLRVRDTGHGLNDNELAAALQPFRAANDEPGGVNLSLTRALVEANRAQFNIKTAPHGTLIEVVFSHTPAAA